MEAEFAGWLPWVASLGTLLLGGGGVAAWYRIRVDKKLGVSTENRADSDSLNAQAVAMIETQFTYLVKPLKEEITSLRDDVKRLKEESRIREALYRIAIRHIEDLYRWIVRHMPIDVQESTETPKLPTELSGEVQI